MQFFADWWTGHLHFWEALLYPIMPCCQLSWWVTRCSCRCLFSVLLIFPDFCCSCPTFLRHFVAIKARKKYCVSLSTFQIFSAFSLWTKDGCMVFENIYSLCPHGKTAGPDLIFNISRLKLNGFFFSWQSKPHKTQFFQFWFKQHIEGN